MLLKVNINYYIVMKKVLLSTILAGVVLSTASVFAEVSSEVVVPIAPTVTSVVPEVEATVNVKFDSLTKLKARGALLIKQRINSLNANAAVVAASKNLTTEQKAAFAAFFSGKVTELTALSAKISAGVDASSTRPLVTSIFTDFRIYAIVLPQVRLEKRIYELQNHVTKLTETFTKVQAKIDEQKTKGKDVTTWQKNLDDAKTLVAADVQKLTTLFTQISALKPSDYGTSSKATIQTVNVGVRAVAKDFNSIHMKVRRPEILKRSSSTSVNVGAATNVVTPVINIGASANVVTQ